jgi:hypothetical protein
VRAARRLTGAVLAVLACLVLLPAPVAAADPVPSPDAGRPWFGPGLDWTDDSAAEYADRLGTSPSLYSQRVNFPLRDEDTTYLRQFAEQAATQGAVAAVTLEPIAPLTDLGPEPAAAFADELARLHEELDLFVLVRFAPEMNGSWYRWGQQPAAYVAAFRTVAEAVHDATPHAAMVWSPVYGAGYPFGAAYGDVDPDRAGDTERLDTDGSGLLDGGDDPYGPYWPGADAVDWVGITLYHFGVDRGREENDLDPVEGGATGDDELSEGFEPDVAPEPGDLEARFDETYGYGDAGSGRQPFYDRFAERYDKPLLLETGALWRPDGEGDPELQIKQTWWRQVLAAVRDHPRVGAISWLEQRRPEAEVQGDEVDWRATRSDRVADALREDLLAAGIPLGAVTDVLDQETGNEATAQGRMPGRQDLPSSMDWITWSAVVLAGLFLLSGLVGRVLPRWRYDGTGTGSRDLRVDLFRGFLICTVVVTHTEVAGPLSWFALNVFGAISGAEAFVAVSGLVVGMVHRTQAERLGDWAASLLRWRRARKLYVTAVVSALTIYLLGLIPGVDATVVTTFTDRGTGEAGAQAAGRVYDLYVNAPRLLDYPPPWYAVRDLLLLGMGPWVLNVLGLFAVLIALSPPLLWLLRRRLWWVVLALSWAAYAWGSATEAQLLPSQFEDVFPLLIWQVPFLQGMVLGYHREAVTRALTGRVGKAVCAVLVAGYAVALAWLALLDRHGALYDEHYVRVFLQSGRLVDLVLVLVVMFAFLTTFWKPVNAAVGRFFVPLGQASLYVFVVHAFLVVAVASVPGLDHTSAWQGAVVHLTELLVVWVLVTRRFLFSIIPR